MSLFSTTSGPSSRAKPWSSVPAYAAKATQATIAAASRVRRVVAWESSSVIRPGMGPPGVEPGRRFRGRGF